MNHSPIRLLALHTPWPALLFASLFCFSGCKPKGEVSGADESIKGPATVEQAARAIDLTTFPLMDGAAPNPNRAVASLNYTVPKTTVKSAFDFQRQKLTAQGWKESVRDTSVTEQAASATFKRNGFVLSVSAYPGGPDGAMSVGLNNHGNINYSKLPRPGGTTPLYVGDATAMYVTAAPVPATAEECRRLLLADGWQPYGSAGDSTSFKQNAIRLTATVSSAPAQGGKTVISYSSELMSADLPAPDRAEDLRYSDMTKELSFETADTKEAIVDFYRQTLGPRSWKSTLEKTVDIDDKPTMIFRNPSKDLLTLSFSSAREGKIPVSLQHQSAAEIAELERRIKEKMPQIKAEMQRRDAAESAAFAEAHKPLPKVAVTLPGDASEVEQTAGSIKFTVGKGKARGIAEGWQKQFQAAGWKEEVATLNGMAGAVSLSKDKMSLNIHYTDTGFTPAEVNISAMGAELESSNPGQP
jgi:hypothetical protein